MTNCLAKWEQTWVCNFTRKLQLSHYNKITVTIQTCYVLKGHILESINTAKYFGINSSNNMSWDTHIKYITTKVNKILGFLKRNLKEIMKKKT